MAGSRSAGDALTRAAGDAPWGLPAAERHGTVAASRARTSGPAPVGLWLSIATTTCLALAGAVDIMLGTWRATVWALAVLALAAIAVRLLRRAAGSRARGRDTPASPGTPDDRHVVEDEAVVVGADVGERSSDAASDDSADQVPTIAAPNDLERLVGRLDHALFRIGVDGDLLFLSDAWERMTGYNTDESLGRPLTSYLHPNDRDDAESALALVSSGRKDHLMSEVRLLSGRGTVCWVELRVRGVADRAAGAGGAIGTVTDITRRKQIEEGLRSSRRHLNTLLANVPGMVYRGRHDRRWTMEFVSDGCVELTGYEPNEIMEGGRIAFGDLIHPDDQEFVWALVATQLAQSKSFQLSYRIVDAARETKWVWEQGRGVFSSSGDLLALEGFITDVSARRGAEEVARRKLWFDARTGLASRAIFDDRLAYVLDHSRAVGYRCAVFWVDLDNFGEVNARFGRDFGDRVLVQMARRFKVFQGPGATVARVGGDEFAGLITDLRFGGATAAVPAGREFDQSVVRFAERLATTLAAPLRLDGQELRLTASIGMAVSRESHLSPDALLQDARHAAGEARASGAGAWRFADR